MYAPAIMVELRQSWEVKWQDGKWVSFAASMVEEFENNKYLRLRPTHAGLLTMLSKGTPSKNASLAASPALANLVKMRNAAALSLFDVAAAPEAEENAVSQPDDDPGNENSEGDSECAEQDARIKKKRKIPPGPYTVVIPVNGTNVQLLMMGVRPSKSDLLVQMEPAQLASVFATLAADVEECLNADKRQYKKRRMMR